MRGQRIIDRLSTGDAALGNKGLTKRELKKRVSVKYRREEFEQDYNYLLQNNVIGTQRVGRVLRTVVTCPGVHNDGLDLEARAESAPLPDLKVGDRVQINYSEYPEFSGWSGPGVLVRVTSDDIDSPFKKIYSVQPDNGEFAGVTGGFFREHLTLLTAQAPTDDCDCQLCVIQEASASPSETLQAELEPIPEPTPRTVADFPVGARIRVLSYFVESMVKQFGEGARAHTANRVGTTGTVVNAGRKYVLVSMDKDGISGVLHPSEIEVINEYADLSAEIKTLETQSTGCGSN